jgi:hypothetical protein
MTMMDEQKKETRYELTVPDDIFQYADQLGRVVEAYDKAILPASA